MTRVKVTYIALDKESGRPIESASNFEDLRKALDEYFGIGKDKKTECLGFHPYETKYPDEYEGYYKYKWQVTQNDGMVSEFIDEIKVYCINYYPHTVYEVSEKELPTWDDVRKAIDMAREERIRYIDNGFGFSEEHKFGYKMKEEEIIEQLKKDKQ